MPFGLTIAALCGLLFAAGALLYAWRALRAGRRLRGSVTALCSLLLLAFAALAAAVSVATRGYRVLTTEILAATLRIEPLPDKHFHATVVLPGQPVAMFDLAGDVFFIEARILTWHPVVGPLGLHSGYELDRVAGRYKGAADERGKARTTYPLSQARAVDMFGLVKAFPFLAWVVDAEHKSATVSAAGRAANFDILVSTAGLVIRAAEP